MVRSSWSKLQCFNWKLKWEEKIMVQPRVLLNGAAEAGDAVPISPYLQSQLKLTMCATICTVTLNRCAICTLVPQCCTFPGKIFLCTPQFCIHWAACCAREWKVVWWLKMCWQQRVSTIVVLTIGRISRPPHHCLEEISSDLMPAQGWILPANQNPGLIWTKTIFGMGQVC